MKLGLFQKKHSWGNWPQLLLLPLLSLFLVIEVGLSHESTTDRCKKILNIPIADHLIMDPSKANLAEVAVTSQSYQSLVHWYKNETIVNEKKDPEDVFDFTGLDYYYEDDLSGYLKDGHAVLAGAFEQLLKTKAFQKAREKFPLWRVDLFFMEFEVGSISHNNGLLTAPWHVDGSFPLSFVGENHFKEIGSMENVAKTPPYFILNLVDPKVGNPAPTQFLSGNDWFKSHPVLAPLMGRPATTAYPFYGLTIEQIRDIVTDEIQGFKDDRIVEVKDNTWVQLDPLVLHRKQPATSKGSRFFIRLRPY